MQDASAMNPDNSKGWLANANLHKQFCSIPDDDSNQIHFCWWFLAWHRAYIVVTERKLRAVSGDDTLSYPYWNWSSDRTIPAPFARVGSSLASAARYPRAQPLGLTDGEVGYNQTDPKLKALGVTALGSTFFEARSAAEIPFSFGGISRPNSEDKYDNNALEATPHGPVHNYSGGSKRVGGRLLLGDMTDFETAARDPIFFAHHSNLDRLWENWRKNPRNKATEPKSDAFLNHSFVFSWLDGTLVEIAMADILDTTRLGYTYDYLDVFRNNAPPLFSIAAAATPPTPPLVPLPSVASGKLSIPSIPLAAGNASQGSPERKYLEITGLQNPGVPITIHVVLKPADVTGAEKGVEVGTLSAVASGGRIAWPSGNFVFDITDQAERYSGHEMTVDLIPERLGQDAEQAYPPLTYKTMRIINAPSSSKP